LSLEAVKYAVDPMPSERELFTDLAFRPETLVRRSSGFAEYAGRLAAMASAMQTTGTWAAHHPWMDLFVSADAARVLTEAAMAALDPNDFLDAGYIMTYPLNRAASETPCINLPEGPKAYLFDVLPSVRRGEVERLSRIERACRELYALGYDRGARVYPIGYPVGEMTREAWKRQLGDYWTAFLAAQSKLDPDRIFRSLPEGA
jgi:hypothetical protein